MTRAVFRYYTVGLNEVVDMQTSYIFGLKWTPHTKIKGARCNFFVTLLCTLQTRQRRPGPHSAPSVDDDTARLQRILAALLPLKPAAANAMCVRPAASPFNAAFLF